MTFEVSETCRFITMLHAKFKRMPTLDDETLNFLYWSIFMKYTVHNFTSGAWSAFSQFIQQRNANIQRCLAPFYILYPINMAAIDSLGDRCQACCRYSDEFRRYKLIFLITFNNTKIYNAHIVKH